MTHCTSRSLGPHKFLDVQNLVTSQQTYFYISQHRLQCFHSCDMIHTKRILFIPAKLVLDGKMFSNGDTFPDSAETPLRRDFRAIMDYDYRQGKSFGHCFKCSSRYANSKIYIYTYFFFTESKMLTTKYTVVKKKKKM